MSKFSGGITWIHLSWIHVFLKVAFFQKEKSFFRSPNLKRRIFQKTISNLKFKIPAQNSIMLLKGILNFKFKIVFWNIFFLRFGDLKNESHFLKKATFSCKKICNLLMKLKFQLFSIFPNFGNEPLHITIKLTSYACWIKPHIWHKLSLWLYYRCFGKF